MPIIIRYADTMRSEFPELATRSLNLDCLHSNADVSDTITRFHAVAVRRLALSSETEFPEIQAWRRAYAKMGLKATQYRCASEALLRRFRKEGSLPRLHPLIDLCNAASLAYGIPIAAFDAAKIAGVLEVRPAIGEEIYETFSGAEEKPEPGEIIFADSSGRAHSRRWTNRQSGYSAVQDTTLAAFVAAEALHLTAAKDIACLLEELEAALLEHWPAIKLVSA